MLICGIMNRGLAIGSLIILFCVSFHTGVKLQMPRGQNICAKVHWSKVREVEAASKFRRFNDLVKDNFPKSKR